LDVVTDSAKWRKVVKAYRESSQLYIAENTKGNKLYLKEADGE